MPWADILEELRKKESQQYQQMKADYPQNLVTNPEENPGPQAQEVSVPMKQWYQMGDWFTRQDELLEAIFLQLKSMAALQAPAPTIEQPPIEPIPPDLLAAAQQQVQLLGLVRNYLEGFNFLTGQAVVAMPGTRVEVISTVKTYLVFIRAHTTNTGNIYIGGPGVSATNGYILGAGEAMVAQIDNLKKSIYLDADVAGEGVSFLALID